MPLELLAESGARTASANDVDTMLSRIAQASLSGVADVSIFDVFDTNGTARRLVIAAPIIPPEVVASIQSYTTNSLDTTHPIAQSHSTKRSVYIPIIDERYLQEHISQSDRRQTWRETALRSIIVAPMLVENQVLGTLTLLRTHSSMPFDQQDVRVVEEIARRTAVAIDHIRLREISRAESVERDEHFHRIADAIPQLMWVSDDNGQVEWVNQRWLDYTGQTSSAALGEGWRNITHPDDQERANATWARSRQDEIHL